MRAEIVSDVLALSPVPETQGAPDKYLLIWFLAVKQRLAREAEFQLGMDGAGLLWGRNLVGRA